MAARGVKRKPTVHPQRNLRPEWLDEFPSWPQPMPEDVTRAWFKICAKDMNAEHTQLVRHEVNISKKYMLPYLFSE